MPINTKNFIKSKLSALGIDSSSGTGVGDVLINPLSYILESYDSTYEELIDKFSKINIEDLSAKDMSILATSFLLTRTEGNKSTGSVYFYYSTPATINLLRGTAVVSGGLRYEIAKDFTISSSSLTYSYPYYITPAIPITAVAAGAKYNLPKNSIFELDGYASKTPVKISNTSAVTSGTNNESNVALYERIKNSLFGNFLSSPLVISNYLKDLQSTIQNVAVIGNEHPLMLRDLVYDISDDANYNTETFEYVRVGTPDPNLDKLHKAYYGEFADTDTGTDLGFPTDYTAWSDEFTQDMYYGLYNKSDGVYALTSETPVLTDFTSTQTVPTELTGSTAPLLNNSWNIKDGSTYNNELEKYSDVSVIEGALRIGFANLDTSLVGEIGQYFSEAGVSFSATSGAQHATVILDELEDAVVQSVSHNPSPVVTKQIDQHTGIRITTTMLTTDSSEQGSMSYVTVFKNNLIFSPYDGFGFAWRKQPEYLIRMDKNNYGADAEQKASDLEKFYEEYKLDGNVFLGKLSGNRGTIHADAISTIWKYSVYIVDNNILEDEVWISSQQVWNQASGRDQFLSAGKAWIEEDIEYDLRVDINENMGIEAFIDSVSYVSFGPNTPDYVPDSAEDIIVGSETAQKNQFGIGVLNSGNYEWYYKNLEIIPIINVYPGHLFKIDASAFTSTNGVTYEYSGMAYDIDNTTDGTSEVQLKIYNITTDSWELCGVTDADSPLVGGFSFTYDDHKISSSTGTNLQISALTDYLDGNDFIYFAAMPVDDTIDTHALRSYYMEVNDGEYTGVHKGNMLDVYVHDPDNIKEEEVELTVSSQEIDFTDNASANGYIQEIVDVAEAYSDIAISQSDWFVGNEVRDRGIVFSSRNKFKIYFSSSSYDGSTMKIKYRYWTKGSTLENYLSDSSVRPPATNLMLKVSPPAVVTINSLEYSGDVDLNTMRSYIAEYINTLNSTTLEKSDLVAYMYEQGATYVSLSNTMEIRLLTTEMGKEIISFTADSYTIPSSIEARFYTNINELTGVTKI